MPQADWGEFKKQNAQRRAIFIASLDSTKKNEIVRRWIKLSQTGQLVYKIGEAEKNMADCMHDPGLGLEMIVRVLRETNDDQSISLLGTWHLENWLAIHGEKVINRVETLAEENADFKRLLGLVYQSSMSLKVYARVIAVASDK